MGFVVAHVSNILKANHRNLLSHLDVGPSFTTTRVLAKALNSAKSNALKENMENAISMNFIIISICYLNSVLIYTLKST